MHLLIHVKSLPESARLLWIFDVKIPGNLFSISGRSLTSGHSRLTVQLTQNCRLFTRKWFKSQIKMLWQMMK